MYRHAPGCQTTSERRYISSAAVAAATSASATVSSGEWLMPPLPHRTNSMPAGPAAAISMASCPAPLVRRGTWIAPAWDALPAPPHPQLQQSR